MNVAMQPRGRPSALIMVVDADRSTEALVTGLIDLARCAVVAATDASEALALAQRQQPDVAVVATDSPPGQALLEQAGDVPLASRGVIFVGPTPNRACAVATRAVGRPLRPDELARQLHWALGQPPIGAATTDEIPTARLREASLEAARTTGKHPPSPSTSRHPSARPTNRPTSRLRYRGKAAARAPSGPPRTAAPPAPPVPASSGSSGGLAEVVRALDEARIAAEQRAAALEAELRRIEADLRRTESERLRALERLEIERKARQLALERVGQLETLRDEVIEVLEARLRKALERAAAAEGELKVARDLLAASGEVSAEAGEARAQLVEHLREEYEATFEDALEEWEAERAQLTQRIEDLEAQLGQVRAERETLRETVDRSAAAERSLRAQVETLRAEVERVRAIQVPANPAAEGALERAQEELDRWRQRHGDLERAIEELKVELDTERNRARRLAQERGELEEQLAHWRGRVAELESAAKQVRGGAAQWQMLVDTVQTAMLELEQLRAQTERWASQISARREGMRMVAQRWKTVRTLLNKLDEHEVTRPLSSRLRNELDLVTKTLREIEHFIGQCELVAQSERDVHERLRGLVLQHAARGRVTKPDAARSESSR